MRDYRSLVIDAIIDRLSNAATGITAAAQAAFAERQINYTVPDFDWSATSPNVALINTDNPEAEANSQISSYPALFIFTRDAQNMNIQKSMWFSGNVVAVIDARLLYQHRRDNFSGMEIGDIEHVSNAFEAALYGIMASQSIAWAPGIAFNRDINIQRSGAQLLPDGWAQRVIFTMNFEVSIP